VLVELGSLTTCPYCPKAIETLQEIFESHELPFFYITLVYDKSNIARWRGMWLGDVYVPVLYVDGGYEIVQETSESRYKEAIEKAMEREVNDLDMMLNAKWDNNDIKISLNITNNGEKLCFEHLRICIVEINSRWKDFDGKNIHYALMDYAFNGYILLRPKATKEIDVRWINDLQMQKGNTMVLACVANWYPHITKNPWNDPLWSSYFLAQFIDEVCAIEI